MSVLGRIWDWFRERKRWSEAHRAAWRPALERTEGGVSKFQVRAVARLRTYAAASDVDLDCELIQPSDPDFGPYFTGAISGNGVEFWIYEDGLEVRGPRKELRLEKWDVETPEEAISKFLNVVDDNVS